MFNIINLVVNWNCNFLISNELLSLWLSFSRNFRFTHVVFHHIECTPHDVFHNTRLCLTVILPNAFWALVLDIVILISFYPLRFSFQFRFCYIPNFKYIQYILVHTDKTHEHCTNFKPIWRQHWNIQFNFTIHSGCMHLDAHTHSHTLAHTRFKSGK